MSRKHTRSCENRAWRSVRCNSDRHKAGTRSVALAMLAAECAYVVQFEEIQKLGASVIGDGATNANDE